MLHDLSIIAISAAVLLSMVTVARAEEPTPGKQIATSFQAGDATLDYWIYLPKGEQPESGSPLLLFLHGAGERGDDLAVVKKHGPPKLIEAGQDFPFVVVSPQCPERERWEPKQLAALVEHLVAEHSLDGSRLYVTGLSMGGYGTWALIAEYPELFAAAVPVCGGGDVEKVDAMAKTPVWAFHGGQDRVVPPRRSEVLVDALKERDAEVKLTVYPEAGHDSWTKTYDNAEVYAWLLEHRRDK